MNDKLKYDHFKNTKELLEHIAVWYRDDDVYFSRWFGLNDLNNLRIYINQLQSNWNSLRELIEQYLENEKYSYMSDNPKDRCRYDVFMEIKYKMNELEGKDK